jgi:hypothetical protein
MSLPLAEGQFNWQNYQFDTAISDSSDFDLFSVVSATVQGRGSSCQHES